MNDIDALVAKMEALKASTHDPIDDGRYAAVDECIAILREHVGSGWQPIGNEQKGDGSDIGPIIFAGAKGVRPGYVRWNPYGECWESAYSVGEKGGLPYFPKCATPPTHWMTVSEIEDGLPQPPQAEGE